MDGKAFKALKATYAQAMEALYLACIVVSATALVAITLVIPYGVFMRYVLNSPASWPEPFSDQTLEGYKTQFELRTIRNVIIKQNSPQDDDSSMYEVFNRLNTGGVNLKPQEIRTSMYHSNFYEMLYRSNSAPAWRKLLGNQDPDLHMKDVEVMLRGFALLVDGENYAPSMVKFLNHFSRKARGHSTEQNGFLALLMNSFLEACTDLPENAFLNKKNGRFNVALFEAAFVASCKEPFSTRRMLTAKVQLDRLTQLEGDKDFLDAMVEGTTQTKNVKARLARASQVLGKF